jgi:hypothetical protein
LLRLAGHIEKIFRENMQRAGAVVYVNRSSVAERNLPSSVFFHCIPPKKEPDARLLWRDIGLWVLSLWPLKIRNQKVG